MNEEQTKTVEPEEVPPTAKNQGSDGDNRQNTAINDNGNKINNANGQSQAAQQTTEQPKMAEEVKPQNDHQDEIAPTNQKNEQGKADEENRADQTDEVESAEDDENEKREKPNWFARLALIGVGLVIVALLLIFGIVPRVTRARETKETAEQRQNALPKVNVAKPQLAPETSDLLLSGTTEAVEETAINARASGYLTRRFVDIGDRVHTGQVLAEIDTPEIDEQLRQARQQVAQAEQQVAGAQQEVAQARQGLNQARAGLQQANAGLKQARTNQELANVTSRRSNNLAQRGLVSQQEADQNRAALDARGADTEVAIASIGDREANIGAQQAVINTRLADVSAQRANVEALKANVRRLQELQGFRRITAPFNGIITARNVDVGGLVSGGSTAGATSTTGTDNGNPGTGGGSSSGGGASNGATGGLFRVARLDAMRTYVNVPQTFAGSIKPGLITQVEIKELPQRLFDGRVTRTSNSLDPNSRTLLTEVLIGNDSGQLLPGMYAQIKFAVPRTVRAALVPSSALISRADGTSVIVVRPDNTIHYQKVEVGRDYGKQIEILNGLETNNMVVTNPTDSLKENTQVEARDAPPENGNQAGGNQPGNQQNQQQGSQQSGSQPPKSGNLGGGK